MAAGAGREGTFQAVVEAVVKIRRKLFIPRRPNRTSQGYRHCFNNVKVEGFPTGVRAKSVSVYLWDGLERGLKECWLRLVYSGFGTWALRKADNLDVWSEFLATLGRTSTPSVWGTVKEAFGGTYALESSAFLCFEFEGSLDGYDTASPWVVYGAWHQERLSSGHIRITFFRNQVAHENPDHEIWRKAEYEAESQSSFNPLPKLVP